MKNPLTPAGIEPATFRFVAQNLNHGATAVPRDKEYRNEFAEIQTKQQALRESADLLVINRDCRQGMRGCRAVIRAVL